MRSPSQPPLYTQTKTGQVITLQRGRSKNVDRFQVTSPSSGLVEFDSNPGTMRSPAEHKGSPLLRKPAAPEK